MAAKKKKSTVDLDRLVAVDDERRKLMTEMETRRAEQKRISDGVPQATDPAEKQRLIAEMQELKSRIQADEEALKPVIEEWQSLMLQVPNVPDMSVPDGESDEDNLEHKVWGDKPSFDFEPKDHVDIGEGLKQVDFEAATKIAGSRFTVLKSDVARLHR